MSQRGGEVQSNLRLSDKEIHSDLIPYGEADMIIAVEPMESLRHLPMLSKKGWIITNTTAFVNIPNYPDKEALMDEIGKIPNHIALDADTIAKDVGASKSANMVVLGAASPFINIDYSLLENGIRRLFITKGEDVVNFNLAAMKAGRNITEEKLKDSR